MPTAAMTKIDLGADQRCGRLMSQACGGGTGGSALCNGQWDRRGLRARTGGRDVRGATRMACSSLDYAKSLEPDVKGKEGRARLGCA